MSVCSAAEAAARSLAVSVGELDVFYWPLGPRDRMDVLFLAVKMGRVDALQAFLSHGFDFGISTTLKDTVAHVAALHDRDDVLRFLVSSGKCDLNACNYFDETPVHIAALNGHANSLAVLTAAGARLDDRDTLGVRPLHKATVGGHNECVDILLRNGVDPDTVTYRGDAPIHLASKNGHLRTLETLVKAGAGLDAIGRLRAHSLHLAVEFGHDQVTDFLVSSGASLDYQDSLGNTPVHIAAKFGRARAIEILSGGGADLGVGNMTGDLPVHVAARYGKCDALVALRVAGADLTPTNMNKEQPMHLAAKHGNAGALAVLLESGCDFRIEAGYTFMKPIHYAVVGSHRRAVEVLSMYPSCGEALGRPIFRPAARCSLPLRPPKLNVSAIEVLSDEHGDPRARGGLKCLADILAYVAVYELHSAAGAEEVVPVASLSFGAVRMALRHMALQVPACFAGPDAVRYLEAVCDAGSLQALVTRERYSLAVTRALYLKSRNHHCPDTLMHRIFCLPRGAGDLVLSYFTDIAL